MSNCSLPDWLILWIWQALLGEIYQEIRAIAARYSDDRIMTIRYYLDREPAEYDYESIDIVIFNILTFDTVGGKISSAIDECVFSKNFFKDIDILDGLVYARREY